MMDMRSLNAREIAALTISGSVSVEAIVRQFLDRIHRRDADVLAWAWMDPEAASEAARRLDSSGPRGALFGVPIAVKDVFQTKDMPTEHNSPIYEGHCPAIDAACIDTLRAAGALILGKTATVEFAGGIGRHPETRHPMDRSRSPGGTSSGSVAAVADRQTALALGTQTAGSTIRPASFCGVHAIKPTWGTVSREGVKFISVSLDTVTWMGRSTDDLELLCDVFAIEDALPAPERPIEDMVIGICRTPFWDAAAPSMKADFNRAAKMLEKAGASVVEFDLPQQFGQLQQAHLAVMLGEGRVALLNEYRAHPTKLDAGYVAIIEGSNAVSPGRLRSALDLGARCRIEFDVLAEKFDAILTPSAADRAPLFGEGTGDASFNQMWSMLHCPCVNIPYFTGDTKLPIGLTLTGPRYADRRVLKAAYAVEQALRGPSSPNADESHL